jgi:zinc protease
MRRALLPALLLAFSHSLLAAGAVHEYQLANGLKLIVKEDHRAPVVVSQVWYKVGSSYEYDGITGLSHMLEHMMFQGTKNHAPGEFSRIISENGGEENAFTSQDYTAYYQRLGKDRLPVSFELEADRMRNLLLQQQEYDKERKVVMEERRLRTEDQPTSLTYEQFAAAAFTTSSYRYPTIGWMNDLENMRLGDLQGWYKRWYAPNNAVLVVVGDVVPDEVLKLARKYFEPLKPETITPPKPRIEPEQQGTHRITVEVPAEVPYLLIGYKVPSLKTAEQEWEPYALEVLSGILDGGDSARLTRNLVRGAQVAASAGAGYDLYDRQSGLFLLDGTPENSTSMETLEAALHAQVKKLQEAPVTDEELARVKAQVVASDVFQKDSIMNQAMQIGQLESVGLDWSLMDQYVARVNAVTAEQVQAVAKKYLVEERQTVAVLKPLPMDASHRPHPSLPGGGHNVR